MTRENKRSPKGAGTIRKRSDGRWEARVIVGRDSKTGRPIRKSIYGYSQKEVRQALTKISSEVDDGSFVEPSKMRLDEWMDIWLNEFTMGIKESTRFNYREEIRLHIKPYIGNTRLCDLTLSLIQRMYNLLEKGTANQRPLSAKTIKDVHSVLHSALEQAVIMNYIRFNPTKGCRLPKIIKKDIQPLSDEKLVAFLRIIQGNKYETLYKLYIFTGLRESELLGLTWDCVDFANGEIIINKQLSKEREKGGKYELRRTKNDKTRRIAPAAYVMDLLKEQRTAQLTLKEKAGVAWKNDWNLVFTHENGKFISYRVVYDEFKRIANIIGIPNARVHDLRHTYAVNSLRAGDDIKTVQENLGHATASFTLDVYGHCTDDMRKASAVRMNEFIAKITIQSNSGK